MEGKPPKQTGHSTIGMYFCGVQFVTDQVAIWNWNQMFAILCRNAVKNSLL